jgi:ribonuclease BN (tRNA processing enzyme)
MRLTVVGSGTAAPDADRVCASFFLDTGDTRVLMDCGPGAVHHMARFGLPWQRLDCVVLSHFHNDHIGDVPTLLFALKWGMDRVRTEPLRIIGPNGLAQRLASMAAAFGDHVSDPGCPLLISEVDPGDEVRIGADLTISCARTPHTEESLAFRCHAADGGSIGYTGDTGPSMDVARFLRGVDLMIGECAFPDDQAMPIHLTPTELARMTMVAAPSRLLVTHAYPRLSAMDVPALVRGAGWTGPVMRASDGMVLASPATV